VQLSVHGGGAVVQVEEPGAAVGPCSADAVVTHLDMQDAIRDEGGDVGAVGGSETTSECRGGTNK
jgi:hypothetical protein